MKELLISLAAIGVSALAIQLILTLREVNQTLRSYRNLESRIIPLLDNSRRITANVEEITRQVTIQTARIDAITENAMGMVENVRGTVDMYNRAIARPAVMAASVLAGVKTAAASILRRDAGENENE